MPGCWFRSAAAGRSCAERLAHQRTRQRRKAAMRPKSDALLAQRFGVELGAGELGAGKTIGSVDTPLAMPLAPFRIWIFFMLGSERKPIPSSLRFGSVMTKALSLEIWFFCWL